MNQQYLVVRQIYVFSGTGASAPYTPTYFLSLKTQIKICFYILLEDKIFWKHETKSKQKIQDCARFTRKINFIDFACVRQSSIKLDSALTYCKIVVRSAIPKAFGTKLASNVSKIRKLSSRLKQGRFLTPLSLIF